ncbi:hypothetical protein CFO_g2723 [Ceratocystis platani]|uniref:Uncharacterized protein n=1 Tax=Ceratocystis fimbriata f. sp. platani TaxID=88771 RepID=A0A0F8DG27_CERFI|nr:hypothetical protein CFO_g2723 [Ceratocystis platani]
MSVDSPEQLLDAFRAAALSVTKLYKTSASAQNKARLDGYQDCLEDLLAFLDRENIGLGDALSDSTATPTSRPPLRSRLAASNSTRNSQSRHLGRGSGQKRKLNIAEIFDFGDLGNGKDMFGSGPKRNRHA